MVRYDDRLKGAAVTLYNALGQPVAVHRMEAGDIRINTGDHPGGIYFLEIKAGEYLQRVKVNIVH